MEDIGQTPKRKDWQQYVDKLLARHHELLGLQYQRVFDGVNGDAGLDGFGSDGHGYQAYADEGTFNQDEQTRKLKRKISDDLGKLEVNADYWKRTFGDMKLKFWTLVVPDIRDKSVLAHAADVAAAIRDKGLPFIDQAFRPLVKTPADFPAAKAWMDENTKLTWPLKANEPTETDIAQLRADVPTFQANIERKLRKAYPGRSEENYTGFIRRTLERHLRGVDLMSQLHRRSPTLYERILEHDAVVEQNVVDENDFSDETPVQRISDTKQKYVASLGETATTLPQASREQLASGIISKWLGNCSLEFIE